MNVRLAGVPNRVAHESEDGVTVGAAAARVGVTIRTLHHWESVGLVSPSERTDAGYRLYTAVDLARIHRVLIYRELGVPLNEIGDLLDAPSADAAASLRRQRDRLRERVAHLERVGAALDRMIEARQSGILLSAEEQVAIFGSQWQPDWVAQAHERWGDTAEWAQYAERAADRTPEQWQRIADTVDALHADLAAAFRRGVAPGSCEADALAERHRASIGAYFDCTHAMQVCLGRRYVSDAEYIAFYDGLEPGLTIWLNDIIAENARANGVDPDTATWA
ncbi:MerR family transcriptional regulator [Nocardia cyriacigeorgica]|uniref:MerR family transcriptional regulator n=1 Tax=Nocardia cyriacigeorgica TaxID=135487 RepID=A0A6P1DI62_9NOCA|nr:MerR family transcriptional regulator [Nocardia cyriacigeorgica]NEW48300.1 MerR family transcriptional regulator [Nocardia cyriacigeorgica]NEW59568.1 MerR family transcriptional regulator [Nocardia cyriacigeorgica]